ncbi:MAG: transposase, partial [Cyanobacteria bacterium P01_C01_bin.72]
ENPYLQYFLGLTKYTNEWDNFNESKDFQSQIEQYQQRFGYYPESVHIDRIYRTRDNRAFCKERKIRISAPPLGRPPAKPQPEIVKQQREDERFRNAIEGKFGQAKRRFSLGRIMAQLSNTAETTIAITFLVMNLELFWKQFFIFLFGRNYDFSSLKNNLIKPLF